MLGCANAQGAPLWLRSPPERSIHAKGISPPKARDSRPCSTASGRVQEVADARRQPLEREGLADQLHAIVHNGRLDPGVQLVTKPFTFEVLASKVRAVLDRAPPSYSAEAGYL